MSLKQRLLWLILSTVALTWVGATVFTYYDAQHELSEVLDAHLAQTSTLLVAQFDHEFEDDDEHDIDLTTIPLPHKYSRSVAFQIWKDGRKLLLRSANAPQTPLGQRKKGFSDTIVDGAVWRVFSTWGAEGELLIQVAEKTEVRQELAQHIIKNLLLPLLVALPLLAVMLWLIVSVGLRPLVELTQAIALRDPNNLSPLTDTAPKEVTPLIERLNRLFSRIQALINNERRFTADAAHELRTPIAAIKAHIQVAQGSRDEAESAQALKNAITGVNRITHLLEQLLTLARLESTDAIELQTCSLQTLAAKVIADMAPKALESGTRMQLTEGDDVRIQGLPILLEVLLRNLLDNAVRYSPDGSLITVGLSSQNQPPRLSIKDNGRGLSPEEIEKVTQRFYRPLGTQASGSGLGLSIVQRIAEIHQAELRIRNVSQGHGLIVDVVFPASLIKNSN